jgi:hypothetical protein
VTVYLGVTDIELQKLHRGGVVLLSEDRVIFTAIFFNELLCMISSVIKIMPIYLDKVLPTTLCRNCPLHAGAGDAPAESVKAISIGERTATGAAEGGGHLLRDGLYLLHKVKLEAIGRSAISICKVRRREAIP